MAVSYLFRLLKENRSKRLTQKRALRIALVNRDKMRLRLRFR